MFLALSLLLAQGGEMAPPEIPVRPQYFVKPTYGPVLCDVSMRVRVMGKGQDGMVTMPVPSDYSGQTVVGFKVQTEPPQALLGWKWRNRADGLNRVAEIRIEPGTVEATVSYTARMLLPGFPVIRTQKRDFANWLGETRAVPAGEKEFIRIANQLGNGAAPTRDQWVDRANQWAAKLSLEGPDADQSLKRAEMCATVLRTAHVPARLVAAVPRVANRRSTVQWRVEVQSDDQTWQAIDPLIGIQHPVRNSAAILSIPSRMDESHGSNNSAYDPEAPTLTTPEISSGLMWAPSKSTAPLTELTVIRSFPMANGARLMSGGYRRSLKVAEAAQKGDGMWIEDAVLRRVMARGATNLALFLDGKPTMPDRRVP